MELSSFVIETTDSYTDWAEVKDGRLTVYRTSQVSSPQDQLLLTWDVEVLTSLMTWVSQDGPVTAHFTGPMAQQIRQHSKELGMTPEMFVWHAVKVFVETGASP